MPTGTHAQQGGEAATLVYRNRIALLFDLDETLASDTYGSVVASCGLDPEQFAREHVKPLRDAGWDEILSKFYALVQASRRSERPITREHLAKVAQGIDLFDGVPDMFDRLEQAAHALIPDVEVDFYLLSSGLRDIAQALPIADRFKQIWGCEFHFDENGAIDFIKQIVTHQEKVRFLLALSKGLQHGTDDLSAAAAYQPVADEQIYVPLDQVIYVGDGSSDVPVFALLLQHGGIAIGLYKEKAQDWEARKEMRRKARVQNLAQPDFRQDSELMRSLTLAVEQICKRIALRKLSLDE